MRAKMLCALLIATLFIGVGVAVAQAIPANTQFDITGFIQAATLDPTCAAGDVLCGGTITVNHQLITVPRNTVLQMPAAALTWQQVFANAPAPYTGSQTGMAMSDSPAPFANYEAHVVGNRVGDTYIAGLIFLAQHSLQSGQGFINYINYTTGEFRVGGAMGSSTSGMRVKINDPAGKFGRAWSPDSRFTIDENNPTVRSETGFPMCIPRTAPPPPPTPGVAIVETDALCPSVNRPLDATSPTGFAMIFTMADPAAVDNPANANSNLPDPRLMAPFEVGDYVTYSGILLQDPGATTTYVAAYQVIANVGLFTTAGISPAYVATDVMLIGVGGTTTAGLTEATARTRFEGFTTDPSRNIVLSGVDVDACTGAASLRNWGGIGIDQGPPKGAVMGRWRFRPPCKGTNLGSITDKVCLGPAAGAFVPVTREMRASIETVLGSGVPAAAYVTKNGLNANAYQAPIFEFLFPENAAVGSPIVPNNFEDIPFLANGSGPLDPSQPASATNPVVGQLLPWPSGFSAPATPPTCAVSNLPPIANAGPDQTVTVSSPVTLTAAGSSDPNTPPLALTYLWTQTAGPDVGITGNTTISPTFTAPASATATLSFQLTVTNSVGSSTATVNVTVTPALPPTITSATASNTQVASNGTVTLTATATGAGPITFAWTQTAGPTGVFTPATADAASLSWTAPPVSVSTAASFQVVASNAAGPSAPSTVSVTINPVGAPLVQALTSQTVASGAAVSIPVSATSPNSKAKLTLAVTPTNLTNFKINGPSQTCGATGCSATWTVTFTAPTVGGANSQVINFSMTASDTSVTPNLSSAAATMSVTVKPVPAPVANAGANQTVVSASNVSLNGSASTNVTTYAWTQISGPAVALTGANTATPSFKAPTVTVLPSIVLGFKLTVTNITGSSSANVTVTVTPVKDTVNITAVVYRIAKQRLQVDATSTAQPLNPSAQLTMQAYDVNNNPIGKPQSMPFSKTLNLYEVIVVGAVQPDHVIVTSTYGGSASSPITLLRTN